MFFGVRDLLAAAHNRVMEDREHELPVATMRPRRLVGRISAFRGACGRWIRARLRSTLRGRHGVMLLTGIFFSGMMICMGYVAERANRAADAIDQYQRTQRAQKLLGGVIESARWAHAEDEAADDDHAEARSGAGLETARDHVLFYITGGE